jgi:hypothetical protein
VCSSDLAKALQQALENDFAVVSTYDRDGEEYDIVIAVDDCRHLPMPYPNYEGFKEDRNPLYFLLSKVYGKVKNAIIQRLEGK